MAMVAQRLKRVFAIDIETCPDCRGKLRVIASVEEPARATASCLRFLPFGQTAQSLSPALIAKILGHVRDCRDAGGRATQEQLPRPEMSWVV